MYVVKKDNWFNSRPWGMVWTSTKPFPLNLSGQSYKTKKEAQAVADKANTLIAKHFPKARG